MFLWVYLHVCKHAESRDLDHVSFLIQLVLPSVFETGPFSVSQARMDLGLEWGVSRHLVPLGASCLYLAMLRDYRCISLCLAFYVEDSSSCMDGKDFTYCAIFSATRQIIVLVPPSVDEHLDCFHFLLSGLLFGVLMCTFHTSIQLPLSWTHMSRSTAVGSDGNLKLWRGFWTVFLIR